MRKLWVLLGLIVLALFVVSCAPKEGDDAAAFAGQAVKVGSKAVRVQCEQLSVKIPEGKTGNQLCQNNGFDTCEHITSKIDTIFYSSEDKTCSGGIQNFFTMFKEELCGSELKYENDVCKTFGELYGEENIAVEPLNGDIGLEYGDKLIGCCKII